MKAAAVEGAKSAKGLAAPGGIRCPHLGCKLTWNPEEETWDCPCHGSRFDKEGNLIDNPAVRNAAVEGKCAEKIIFMGNEKRSAILKDGILSMKMDPRLFALFHRSISIQEEKKVRCCR